MRLSYKDKTEIDEGVNRITSAINRAIEMLWRSFGLLAVVLASVAQLVAGATIANTKAMHPAFKEAGKKTGLEIWRIEDFTPVPVKASDFGKFFEGDSYIVLNTVEDKSNKGKFSWDIHFWLGDKTSQDESGAAAILAVELDDGLGGGPVQHREVQGHESPQFSAYFKSGIRYMPGGVKSGFNHAEINAPGEKKFYQIKGKKNIRVRQVELSVKSMNKGDCFILDTGKEIFLYVGTKAKGTERLKAISVANQIRDQDHNGRAKVNIIDQNSNQNDISSFFTALGGGSQGQVANEPSVDDDQDFEKNQDATVSLYKVSDAGGKLVSEKIGQKPLKQGLLKSEDCFILDTVSSGIYVWIGKSSTAQEKVEALKKGQVFLDNNKYPAWTRMQRIVENAEPTAFKEYFADWKDAQFVGGIGRGGPAPSRNVRSVQSRQCGPAVGFMPDDGSGKVEVFRVENFELVPIREDAFGMFFGGDSYIVKYHYDSERGRRYIIYFWQGQESTADEKSAAALHAVRLDNELGGKAIQIRVEQGHEPAHFNLIFRGRMVLLMGGHASGFRNLRDYDTYDTDGTRLFRILGTCENDVRAVQVPEVAASLNTNDAFLLETPTKSFLWMGENCNILEKETAEAMRTRLCPDREPFTISEGNESYEFWDAIGGPGEYNKEADSEEVIYNSRLFHCYFNENDKFKVEEIANFEQKDLYPDDVMILDAGEEIYIWVGDEATPEEKKNAYKLVQRYLERSENKRKVIVTIKQGDEPGNFINLFPNWDDEYWQSISSFEDLKNEINVINDSMDFD